MSSSNFDAFFKPDRVVIVGVWDAENHRTNLITIGLITYMGIGNGQVITFPVHPARHSHHLFQNERYFVVNLLNAEQYEIAHICGTVSGKAQNKFELAKITPVKILGIDVNLHAIKECPYFMVAERTELKNICGCSHDIVVGKPIGYYETGATATKPLWHVSKSDHFQFLKPYGGKGYEGGYGCAR